MAFRNAFSAARPPLDHEYNVGKRALERRHGILVVCNDPTRLTGSIFLNFALAQFPEHAQAPRWDYGLGYKPQANAEEQAVWIEVHSATTREVGAVLRKLKWLQDWLNSDAVQLKQMTNGTC